MIKNQLPCIYSPGVSATVFLGNRAVSVVAGQPHFNEVDKAIRNNDWEAVAKLVDVITSVKKFLCGESEFEINRNTISYRGEVVDNVVADRILSFMEKGYPVDALVAFLTNLMANPSYKSRQQLYTFLERWNLPITPRGTILAYKAVRFDYTSIHPDKDGTHLDNSIGKLVQMDRVKIDDDSNKHCSAGLHAGALQYVRWYGGSNLGQPGSNRAVIVEINPRDVVSVPNDHDCQKIRISEYRVIGDYVGELPEDYTKANAYDGYDDEDGDDDGPYSDDICSGCLEPNYKCRCD